jgi:glycosyltransferase involved in cell wall biosynthesis
MTEMFGLLYYGRLEREKGFDSILELIKDCHDVEFFIFGTGSLEAHLLPLTQQKNVHYF